MKGFRYFTAILFSLLIIFAGAGVAVIHCYCISCQTTHECCDSERDHSHTANPHADYSNREECCNATVYKIDLLKGAEKIAVITPFTLQLCKRMADLLSPLSTETLLSSYGKYSPSPPEPRRFLALYAVFII